jgi:hypothetical protein
MGGSLGLALTGEDAFAISHDAGDALLRREVCEIPDVLTDHEVQAVEAAVKVLQ